MIRNSTFSTKLLSWQNSNKRSFPWKKTNDPYKIWLSEVILQQTRVQQGLPYYLKFIKSYPTVIKLAQAKEDEVLNLWQGLGYYSRARNLHAASKQIVNDYNGRLPRTHDEWLQIKGVGEYSAAAISSFAFNESKAVVDGNVIRLLARVFGMYVNGKSGKGKKQFIQKANDLIVPKYAGAFNQGIMDFGSIVCTPKNPNCASCVFKKHCYAFKEDKISQLPVRMKAKPKRNRYFTYLVIQNKNMTYISKRVSEDIWKGLYEFPMIESEKPLTTIQLKKSLNQFGLFEFTIHEKKQLSQVLSHQVIHGTFYNIESSEKNSQSHWQKIISRKLQNFALPRIIDSYINLEKTNFK